MREVFSVIARIFQFIRSTILNIFVVLILLLIVVALFAGDGTKSIPNESALVLNPSGNIVEEPFDPDPFTSAFFSDLTPMKTAMPDILRVLSQAASDDRVQILILDFSRVLSIDIAQVERIRKAIRTFKHTSGKQVWAFATNFSQTEYLLSLDADVIAIDPLGELVLSGVSMTSNYYKDLLDSFEVDVNVAVQGDFKAAIEPYVLTSMSPEVRNVTLN